MNDHLTERVVEAMLASRQRRGADAPTPNLLLLDEHDRYLAEHYTELRALRAREDDRLWACFMLARDLDTFQALCAGERVPRALLNQDVLEGLDSWAA